ncbi:MAG TPA: phosphopentomutase, partial [Bacteroidetes bacterium]|nr:phosphopentomutase [Bacteroidota bacterium]
MSLPRWRRNSLATEGKRAFLVILDGVGVGGAPDASSYGDEGSDTLGNLSREVGGLELPNFRRLGLGNLARIEGMAPVARPIASFGRMEERSAGKDSVAGHWEICGLVTRTPFPTYPHGFPPEVVQLVEEVSGRPVLGNEVASGTEIMDRLGAEHVKTGRLILYTSADSVLQLLAHEEVVPLEELYRVCAEIRRRLPQEHRVARVIARPFLGEEGAFVRTSNRRDYAIEPQGRTVLDALAEAGFPVHGIGKVDTLFAGRGFSGREKTKNNTEGIARIRRYLEQFERGLVFANLLDFDMQWGHRNDVKGFHRGLVELDAKLPAWLEAVRPGDLVILTADHGNDPTT